MGATRSEALSGPRVLDAIQPGVQTCPYEAIFTKFRMCLVVIVNVSVC